MVFSGRPSSACHACRTKRLKCDRVRPGCTQCARKRIACPGYRPSSELRIRDETDRVTRKSLGATEVTYNFAQAPQLTAAGPDLTETQTPHPGSSSILDSTTDDSAVSYFMSSYITCGPFQEYLPSMYVGCRFGEDALSAAIDAASFAAYARQTGHRGCMDRGRRSYTLALSRINLALTDPATAVLDQTLASILLLGTFESIVFPGARSPEEWTAHLFGAAKLLQLRGLKQFGSEFGAQLFSHTTSNIFASSMQRFVNMPAEVQSLKDVANPFLDPNDPGNRMSPVLERVVRIKARISNYSKDRGVLYEVFDDAAVLEQEIVELIKDDDPILGYTVRSKEDTPSWAYRGIAYRYKSHRAIKIRNTLRMARLFLLEVMSAGASLAIESMQNQADKETPSKGFRDSYDFTAFKEDARRLADEITTEVLGCLPDFLEPSPTGPRFSPSSRTLVWPLSVIYKNRICPPQAREYARSMADEFVKDLDRLQLVDARKFITDAESAEDWLHLYHLD
ncbi:uncharacterized protein PV07_04116 [Cladophialophora immunda]|uniref:Zn(2)-C6 fungal-type domain-containing protein n=1 Tax=Cladophialophora immunda TaxID=569365 RepID=A0A0D1ZWR3_9EURO|nr:uncharacterized protein PV07_04116 [Cladophialophora immunda]KIW32586.1 hypothetical protein PV07_04116 [Cladophialophora immunda]OQU98942.1 Fungal Zn2-Cys6 binuclear cluster domain-containing protein [Cladophialophora immunda]